MVLDVICSISREEGFVATIPGDAKQNTPSWGSKVRRLSLHATWPTMEMPKLRSLTIFNGDTIISMPSISYLHLLRVLDLEGCSLKEHTNLSSVAHLFHLRYLGLRNTRYAGELPSEIGRLQLLQTVDLYGTRIKELPSSIVGLRRLMCLVLNWIIRLPNGLRNLTSLQVIRPAIIDSAHIAEELGHLTQLRILTVMLILYKEEGYENEGICKGLVESLAKLQKIRHLIVLSSNGVVINLEGSLESLGNLSNLYINKTSSLPTWINPGSLLLLSSLDIMVAQVRREDIHVLGMLQALRILNVGVFGDNIQVLGRFKVGPDAFPCARVCRFYGFETVPSMFPRGAMPRLEDFIFHICPQDFFQGEFTTDDLSLDHFPSLQTVSVHFYRGKQKIDEELVMKVKEKLGQEVDAHPNHPSVF
jgi:disease resistance protein RPM1